jgi:hypothetical protein
MELRQVLAHLVFLSLGIMADQSIPAPDRIPTFMMQRGVVLHRYSFDNGFWTMVAEHFGERLDPGFDFNSTSPRYHHSPS